MKRFSLLLLALLIIVLAGCAGTPQAPIALDRATVGDSSKIGIVMTPLPKVDTSFPGASCLLCMAAAAATNSSLTKHVTSLSAEDIQQIPLRLQHSLADLGYQPVVIEKPLILKELTKNNSKQPNAAKYNLAQYQKEYGVDRLVVVELNFVGVIRNYSSYIPTGDPQASVLGAAYMVSLENNQYLWYQPLKIYQSAEGEWDEPPTFPGITNAFYQALERAIDQVNGPFDEESQKTASATEL